MKMQLQRTDTGNVIICALCTIFIISLIGANVLMNCVTHYNVSSKQLKAWKEALYAAEAGGDIGFAEVRKLISSPGTAFSGWTSPAASPAPTPGPSWSNNNPITFGQLDSLGKPSLSTSVTVDKLTDTPSPPGTGLTFYRIRATGTAKLFGLPRVGMDDAFRADGNHFAANATTHGVGDSLLRKIDFMYDHFKTTYGDGDGNPVPSSTHLQNPKISRRIELVAVPTLLSFGGSLKVTSSFSGPGPAGVVDSYDSKNGAYYFAANNPSDPHYADSQNGDVSVATSSFTEGGPIYGNVTTNGGNVTHSGTQISGTIDNNVPFTIPPLLKPDTTSYTTGSSTAINVPVGTSASYVYSSLTSGVTITATKAGIPVDPTINPSSSEASVTIVVNSDVGGNIVINSNVNAKIYFTGNLSTKARNIVNNNTDNYTLLVPANPSRAGHLQFYGISPPAGTTQTIDIAPPGNVWATMYAPNGDMSLRGNPDWYGAIVAQNFSGNGNTGVHYDKEVGNLITVPIDYQIASFVEDIR